MATNLSKTQWTSEQPPIYFCPQYTASRSGANMSYTISIYLYALSGYNYFGYNIKCDVALDGKKVKTGVLIKDTSPSQWSAKTVSIGTFTVSNKTTGTTSLSVKMYSSNGGGRTSTYKYSLPVSPAASVLGTISSFYFDKSFTVPLTKYNSSFVDTLTIKVGSTTIATRTLKNGSNTITLSSTERNKAYNAITDATSDTVTFSNQTKSGSSSVGSSSKTAKGVIPSSVVPSISSVSLKATSSNTEINSWGVFVSGLTKAAFTVSASGVYGSTIKKYELLDGSTVVSSGTSKTLTSKTITNKKTFTIRVTDTRGRTKTTTKSVSTVYAYTEPSTTISKLSRCDSSGVSNAQGENVVVNAKRIFSSVNEKNSASSLRVRWKIYTETSWNSGVTISDNTNVVLNGVFDKAQRYLFEFSFSDSVGNSSTSNKVLSAAKATLHFIRDAEGSIGIGQFASGTKKVFVGYPSYFNDTVNLFKTVYMGGQSAPEEKSLYFTSPEGSENVHSMRFYGGSATSPTGAGLYDGKNDSIVWRYDDVEKYLRFYFPSYHNGMVQLKDQLRFLYGVETGWTAAIWQPSETVLRLGTKNGKGTTGFFDWIGEYSGDYRFILRPSVNGQGYLGSTTYRWNTGYFTNTITQSDKKDKENIAPLGDKAVAFIRALMPVSYTLKNGEGGRTHLGLIAQDVANAAKNTGMGDLSLYQAAKIDEDGNELPYSEDTPDENLSWGLNYTELIPVLIKAVKNLMQEVDNLKKIIQEIKDKEG